MSTASEKTIAESIMERFATETGVSDNSREPRRYLWTDAFAVGNCLGLFRRTGEKRFLDLAIQLVDQVHKVLGKHREDSPHSGWISGLPDAEARLHPTCGGLRIGKPLDERGIHDGPDDQLEWQQDGQYFHYLTKWMYALNSLSQASGEVIYNQWALELARTAHRAFVHSKTPDGLMGIYWKMSIDLSRPLVKSMGHHDPLDGLVTFWQLQATAQDFAPDLASPSLQVFLSPEIKELAVICKGKNWATLDELGIGMMLSDTYRMAHQIARGLAHDPVFFGRLLRDCEISLEAYSAQNHLGFPAGQRLAFRELGLAIGLQAIASVQPCISRNPTKFSNVGTMLTQLTKLTRHYRLQQAIVDFWLEPANQRVKSWQDHGDINRVMLATCLIPEGYL